MREEIGTMQPVKRYLLIGVTAALLVVTTAAPALAGEGGVPNDKSCGGVGRIAQTFAALPGPIDLAALFEAVGPLTCNDFGQSHK